MNLPGLARSAPSFARESVQPLTPEQSIQDINVVPERQCSWRERLAERWRTRR